MGDYVDSMITSLEYRVGELTYMATCQAEEIRVLCTLIEKLESRLEILEER